MRDVTPDNDDEVMSQGEQMREKWRSWIERHWGELLELRRQREVFHEMRDAMIEDQLAQTFLRMFARMYVRDQVISVRSLTDANSASMSLSRLLHEALSHPGLLSRDWYVHRWLAANPDWENGQLIANREYTRLLGEGDAPDEWMIFGEIKRLAADTNQIRLYANRTVAHISKKPLPRVTFGELEQAVDEVIELFTRWSQIVSGASHHVDGRIGADWKHPFRSALFPGAFNDCA